MLSRTIRKIIQMWFLLVLPFLLPLSGICADNGDYKMYGWGAKPCNTFVKLSTDRDIYLSYAQYINGYITAVNGIVPNTYDILGTLSIDETMLLITNECKKNPLKDFSNAIGEIVFKQLYPERTITKKK